MEELSILITIFVSVGTNEIIADKHMTMYYNE